MPTFESTDDLSEHYFLHSVENNKQKTAAVPVFSTEKLDL